ncbi:MAG: CatB-related O-acetyltransferase [Lachnospiraceae bacterium]|nr:CatB-related O-acetyltransferase [Lachnospiraceae bacterium]
MNNYSSVNGKIEQILSNGYKHFIIYPFGEVGILANQILKQRYGIRNTIIVDNYLQKYNPSFKRIEEIETFITKEYAVLYTSTRKDLYDLLKTKSYFDQIFVVANLEALVTVGYENIGRFVYGELLSDPLSMSMISSIGSFCSFAPGACAVPNHPLEYVTTSPFTYLSGGMWKNFGTPKSSVKKYEEKYKKNITIGNDVWLGRNVTITSGVRIGNGVIAGAGAVITRDVPDYAIVIGVPAKVLRFRFSDKQIEALNKIKWWDWSVETIAERHGDFKNIDLFISKYNPD